MRVGGGVVGGTRYMRQIGKALVLAVALVFSSCIQSPEPQHGMSEGVRLLADGDPDGDGIIDIADNCPIDSNSGQANGDGDEFGDPCDPCPSTVLNVEGCPQDDDGDRIANGEDNCPRIVNVEQADQDGDGRGDACDAREVGDDPDQDGLSARADNCPTVTNTYQSDRDRDGIGDACDHDN